MSGTDEQTGGRLEACPIETNVEEDADGGAVDADDVVVVVAAAVAGDAEAGGVAVVEKRPRTKVTCLGQMWEIRPKIRPCLVYLCGEISNPESTRRETLPAGSVRDASFASCENEIRQD